ncbi:MAG TPA: DUF4190 domain-containing protein [Chloroflexia bacterium]|nr:DUF4190 domain-containing protein [Chloroflexia bacterium]
MSYGNQSPPAGGGYAAPPTAAASGGTNIMAIISLVLGILGVLTLCGFVFGWLAAIFGIIAAILGFMGRNQIKQRGQGGSGLAMAGLVLGIIAVVAGLAELAGLAALIAGGGAAVNQLATQVAATLTAGATPGP